MRTWFTRLLATMFVLSLVASPQVAVLAEGTMTGEIEQTRNDHLDDPTATNTEGSDDSEDESPDPGNVEDEPDTSAPGNGESEGDGETEPEDQVDIDDNLGSDAESTEGTEDEEQNDVKSEADPETTTSVGVLNFDDKNVPLPTYDANTGLLNAGFTLLEGFSASAGQEFSIEYDTWTLRIDVPSSPISIPAVEGLVVDIDPDYGEMIFTFLEDVEPLQEPVTTSVSLTAEVLFAACYPSLEAYPQETYLYFWTPNTGGSVYVEGPECPANPEPTIVDAHYAARYGELEINLVFVNTPIPGQQLTLTYEQDKLFVEPGPYEIFAFAYETQDPFIIGTANAGNGVITIDIVDANFPADLESEFFATVMLAAWLQGETCSTSDAPSLIPGGELVFVSNTGQQFFERYPDAICNLEGPSITGEWGTDELGNPVIHWTIDTGDLANFTEFDVDPFIYDELVYDCDSLDITPVYGDFDVVNVSCDDDYFWYDFEPVSDELFRATIEVTTSVNPEHEMLSVANCVTVRVYNVGNDAPVLTAAKASNGLGGRACYEMFLAPGGDVLTKNVDKTEAFQGETVTYTAQFTTSTNSWAVIDLSETLPAGFTIDPASITCAVEPASYQLDPCHVLSDTTLRVQVRAIVMEENEDRNIQTSPVTITLTYQGEVTGAPGTTLESHSCSVRTYVPFVGERPDMGPDMITMQVEGDQSVVGGGRLCMETSTLVLQPDDGEETPTPTPSPTPDPTGTVVPDPTVPATPTTPADPEPTHAVTGLPETGSGGGFGVQAAFFAAMAATLLMAAVGIRFRPHQ